MPKQKFNTSNPESLHYQNEILSITVLGGIKITGLDRMRVTLKVQVKKTAIPPLRHNLDLYNDTQLEKFIRKACAKLEVGLSVIEASLSELTELLEKYRLDQQKERENQQPKRYSLSQTERKSATEFLQSPNLLARTSELIQQSGIVGESSNALLMYLIFTSRKREKPLHVVSLGASGTGKSHLQEKVGELIPEEDKIEITTLSENAFYYFGQQELRHKLILIEDLDGAETALYPIRELQSKKYIKKRVVRKLTNGETQAAELWVEGPVSVAGCTTREKLYEDNANRSFLIYLDESPEQDFRIMDYQRRASAGIISYQEEQQAKTLLKNCQRILEPISVRNPYAQQLNLPTEVLKPRRTNNHYLQFIEAVTFYKQFQREQKTDKATGEVYIETTLEDIEEANRLLAPVLLRKSDIISGACRNYFEGLKLYLIGQKEKQFTNRAISLKLRIPITTVKNYHLQLYHAGYLKYTKESKGKTHLYEVVSYQEYEQLQQQITGVLDESLQGLQKPNSQVSAKRKSGPVKKQTSKQLEQKPSKTEKVQAG